ncbi:MAG: N-acetyltransferase family protein [bacterium]
MISKSNIRLAKLNDLESIVRIYNQAIEEKFCTADTKKIAVNDRMEWFLAHEPAKYPILVCEIDNQVAGWLSISPYRAGREALRFTVEVSYYVDRSFRRLGIAENLLRTSLEKVKELGYKSIFTIILDRNTASIKLMQKFGFEQWASMPNIADFDGEECGHVYFGIRV